MFHTTAPGAREYFIYRSQENAMGDSPNTNEGPVRQLHGKTYAGKGVGVFAPRTSELFNKSEPWRQQTYSGMTLYTDIDIDIRSGDYLYSRNDAGRPEVWEVESDGSQNFVSPFTSMVAGKEVLLSALKTRN